MAMTTGSQEVLVLETQPLQLCVTFLTRNSSRETDKMLVLKVDDADEIYTYLNNFMQSQQKADKGKTHEFSVLEDESDYEESAKVKKALKTAMLSIGLNTNVSPNNNMTRDDRSSNEDDKSAEQDEEEEDEEGFDEAHCCPDHCATINPRKCKDVMNHYNKLRNEELTKIRNIM